MTREEATKRLERWLKDMHEGYQTHLEHGGKIDFEHEVNMETIAMAIEALQMQIPKSVLKTESSYGTPYACPECESDQCEVHFFTTDGSEPKEKISYCWKCGKAMDWRLP